jgi:hypothetical protein
MNSIKREEISRVVPLDKAIEVFDKNGFRNWLGNNHSEFAALVARLEEEGFKIKSATEQVPVQMEGILPDGENFYFRCRGKSCSLRVAAKGIEPLENPYWELSKEQWEWPEAGWLGATEIDSVFRGLLADYRKDLEKIKKVLPNLSEQ